MLLLTRKKKLGGLQWHNIHTRFHETWSIGSEIERQDTDSMLILKNYFPPPPYKRMVGQRVFEVVSSLEISDCAELDEFH